MEFRTNPQHRVIRAPLQPQEVQRRKLSSPLKLLRLLVFVLITVLMAYFLSVGTLESRLTYAIAFALALANPVWGFYGLALLGPLYLVDPAKTHLLAGLEVFVLGILAGELRLLGRSVQGLDAAGQPAADYTIGDEARRVHWGIWPHFLVGMGFLLLSSSVVGMQLVAFQERPYAITDYRFLNILTEMFYGTATVPEWTLKCLWNWGTGSLLAVIAARRANPLVAARWIKLGGISLLTACVFAMLDWLDWLPLSHIRRPNLDPLHGGRLQGTAGHAGWFGQWIVLMWPGLLLWWSSGRTKRNLGLAGALSLVGLCLILTAARASWLGAGIAISCGCIYLVYTYPETRRYVPWVIGIGLVVALIGFVVGGETIHRRVANLMRAQDRANYYITGFHFLREHPLGIGLGTHYQFYEWTFTPFYRWAQFDHVTAHSLWLHSLIENGPFLPLLLLGGILGLALELKKSWRKFDPHARTIMVALSLGLLGILAIGIAQYIPYLRIVEISYWIAAGMVVGLCRKKRCRVDEAVESTRGQGLLMVCGVLALLTASVSIGRVDPGNLPRHFSLEKNGSLSFWTGRSWQTPVNRDIHTISFSLHRKVLPVAGMIHWPDGAVQPFELQPDEWRYYEHQLETAPVSWVEEPRYLRIEAFSLFTPAEYLDGSDDTRQLGVYIHEMRFRAERLEEYYQAREQQN